MLGTAITKEKLDEISASQTQYTCHDSHCCNVSPLVLYDRYMDNTILQNVQDGNQAMITHVSQIHI